MDDKQLADAATMALEIANKEIKRLHGLINAERNTHRSLKTAVASLMEEMSKLTQYVASQASYGFEKRPQNEAARLADAARHVLDITQKAARARCGSEECQLHGIANSIGACPATPQEFSPGIEFYKTIKDMSPEELARFTAAGGSILCGYDLANESYDVVLLGIVPKKGE